MTSPAADAPYPRPADPPRPAVFILGPAATTAAGLLAATLAEPASPAFYAGTVVSALALVAAWVLGGDHRVIDPARWLAHTLRGVVAGVGLAALFIAGALAVGRIPVLAAPVQELLLNASGSAIGLTLVVTLVNGVAEELFFRNTVPRHLPWLPYPWLVALAVGLYVAVTAAMLVPLLAVAAVAVGLVAHFEVRATGALTSAIVMHATWAIGMLLVLPGVLAG